MTLNIVSKLLIKTASAGILPTRLVPECSPTGATDVMPKCDMCFLAQMGYNIIMTLVYAAFVIVVIMAIAGGIRMFFSGGSQEKLVAAKKHITSSLVWLAIVLLSWAGLNILITALTNYEDVMSSPWYAWRKLNCGPQQRECQAKCTVRYSDPGEREACEQQCPGVR